MKNRLKAHLGLIKGGASYTKSHPVIKVEAVWKVESKSDALRMECALKKLSRLKKLSLFTIFVHPLGKVIAKFSFQPSGISV